MMDIKLKIFVDIRKMYVMNMFISVMYIMLLYTIICVCVCVYKLLTNICITILGEDNTIFY